MVLAKLTSQIKSIVAYSIDRRGEFGNDLESFYLYLNPIL
jgi:hypothetical protein